MLTGGTLKFDFGTLTSPVADGYVGVTPETRYSAATGFGWSSGTIDARDRWLGSDALQRDLNLTSHAVFTADVTPGTYSVTLYLGDVGPYAHDQMQVAIEGTPMETLDTAAGEVVTRTYTVAVADGHLDIGLNDTGGSDPYAVIDGLQIQSGLLPKPTVPTQFDFGTPDSTVSDGSTQVLPTTRYSALTGFGWLNGTIDAVDRPAGSDAIQSDLNLTSHGVFAVDLAPGKYSVTLQIGDAGPYAHDQMQVAIEGTPMETLDTAAGEVVTRTYTVNVDDGQLDIDLQDLGGADPYAVIDGLEIARSATPTRFDFGPSVQPTLDGYTTVNPSTTYTPALGYGWTSGVVDWQYRWLGNNVNRDYVFTTDATFVVDMPNGTYQVTLYMGDYDNVAHDDMAVSLEGKQVDVVSTAPKEVAVKPYQVTVVGGQLVLRIQDLGGADPYAVLNGMDIDPVSNGLGLDAALGDLQLFPSNNPWNQNIANAPVDPNSQNLIQSIGWDFGLKADFGTVWAGAPAGIPYTVVSGDQPKVPIHYQLYGAYSDPGPFPIPADAAIEGGPSSDQDRHVLVLDKDNQILYELFRAFPNPDGSWNADGGAKFDLKSNALRPDGWGSADAAGLPMLPGLVRYDEVFLKGEIDHALRFTVPKTAASHIYPATGDAGSPNAPNLPPMGMRVRLKADFDISKYPKPVQVILQALKSYGMIVADNGGPWFITGAPDPRWDDDVLSMLGSVLGQEFEVVDAATPPVSLQAETVQAGAWSDPATWGGHVPGDGDTITINNPVTVDVNTTIGASLAAGQTPAIVVNAPLTVAPGATLTVRGDVVVGNTALTLQPGSSFVFDSSRAPDPAHTSYVVQVANGYDQKNALFLAEGTANAHVSVRSDPGGAPGRFVNSGGKYGPEGTIQASFTDFNRIGDAQHDAMQPWQGGWGNTFRLTDSTLTDCGPIRTATSLAGNDNFILERVRFLDSTTRPLFFSGWAPLTTGTRLIEGCVFDQGPSFVGPTGLTIRNNFFYDGYYSTESRWADFSGNFVRMTEIEGLPVEGNVSDSYFLQDSGLWNPHFISPSQGVGDVTIDGAIFEYTGTDGQGDAVVNFSPLTPTTYKILRSIVLPNAAGDNSGTLFTLHGNDNTTLIAEHNTFVAGSQGATFGEAYAGHTGMIASFRANLAWTPAGPSRGFKLQQDSYTSATDVAAPASVDYNGGWNLGSGRQGYGYNLTPGATGAFGAHDVQADPYFVDPTRNVESWDRSLGGDGTVAHVLARFEAGDPAYTVAALLSYIRDGFAPQNPAYQNASYAGDPLMSDIGAVPVATVGSGVGTGSGGSSDAAGSSGQSGLISTGLPTTGSGISFAASFPSASLALGLGRQGLIAPSTPTNLVPLPLLGSGRSRWSSVVASSSASRDEPTLI